MRTANREQLESEIIDRSESGNWDEARREWDLETIYDDDELGRCLCGHYPIKERCVLRNNINQKEVTVGNICVHQFMGLPSDRIFKSLKKIKVNPKSALTRDVIELLYRRKHICKWQYDFSIDTLKKRSLTERQWIQRQKVNEIFREKMVRH